MVSRALNLLRACILLTLASFSTFARAETLISGALTDPQAKAVTGASVRLFHSSGALVAETKTDDTGRFAFPNIAPGDYRILASARGLTPVSKDLVLVAEETARADLQFGAVQSQSESIVITAKALEPTLDLRNAEVFNRTLFSRDDQVLLSGPLD